LATYFDIWSRRECINIFKNTYSIEEEIREEERVELAIKILDMIKKGINPAEYLQSIANKEGKAKVIQN